MQKVKDKDQGVVVRTNENMRTDTSDKVKETRDGDRRPSAQWNTKDGQERMQTQG